MTKAVIMHWLNMADIICQHNNIRIICQLMRNQLFCIFVVKQQHFVLYYSTLLYYDILAIYSLFFFGLKRLSYRQHYYFFYCRLILGSCYRHQAKRLPTLPTCDHGEGSIYRCKELSLKDVRRIHQRFYKDASLEAKKNHIL